MGSNVEQWAACIQICLTARPDVQKFVSIASVLIKKAPINGAQLSEICLRPKANDANAVNSRLPILVEALLNQGLLDVPNILRTLLRHSRYNQTAGSNDATAERSGASTANSNNPTELEEIFFFRLSRAFHTNKRPKSLKETWETITAVSRWMSALVADGTRNEMLQGLADGSSGNQPEALATKESLAMLAITMAENAKVLAVLRGSCPKGISHPPCTSFVSLIRNYRYTQ